MCCVAFLLGSDLHDVAQVDFEAILELMCLPGEPLGPLGVAMAVLEVAVALAQDRRPDLSAWRLRLFVEVLRGVHLPGEDVLVDARGLFFA